MAENPYQPPESNLDPVPAAAGDTNPPSSRNEILLTAFLCAAFAFIPTSVLLLMR